MKPEEKDEEQGDHISGDVIGDTAYSQRFVLKILLKFANLDTLKDEINEKSFEDDLCVLWDMTAEKDIVIFLQKYDVLNLINFAFPSIENPRVIEIVIGILGNMCCHKEVVTTIMKMEPFLTCILELVKSDDSLILVQVLRFVNSSLNFLIDGNASPWLDLFTKVSYAEALYFMLKNSTNKVLLVTALENLNTICSYCNTENYRIDFFTNFVIPEALESLIIGFTEVSVNQKDLFEREELERILVITLQITLNLVGFDQSKELYSKQKEEVSMMIKIQMDHYEHMFVNMKEIDSDLSDVLDSTYTIVKILDISDSCGLDIYFLQSLSMYRTLRTLMKADKNGPSSFEEEEDENELRTLANGTEAPLCSLLSIYLQKCCDNYMMKGLDLLDEDFDKVISCTKDKILQESVITRTTGYRTRLKETVD